MMKTFVSAEGSAELKSLRVGEPPSETETVQTPIALLARLPSDECGCPEEVWRVDGLIYLIHVEADAGVGEIHTYTGDDEFTDVVNAPSLDHLRAEMFAKHAALGEN
jgi:hypothetical protein